MALYIIAITGNDINRNRRMATFFQTFLDASYKEFYKTPNYRKYLNSTIEHFSSNLDKTISFINELSCNRKLSLTKTELQKELMVVGNGKLWDSIMYSRLHDYLDQSKRKPNFDFYIIIPDVTTSEQIDALRQFDTTIIFNFESVVPMNRTDVFSYTLLNMKRNFMDGKSFLENKYTVGDVWYHHNKPEHYMKEFCKELIIDLNNERIYKNRK